MKLFVLIVTWIASLQLALASNWGIRDEAGINATNSSSRNFNKRYAENLSSSSSNSLPAKAWPMRNQLSKPGEGYIRKIPFCYVDENAYIKLGNSQCMMREGVNLWSQALGAPAAVNGHSLGFREPSDPKVWCCRKYDIKNFQCDWNFDKWPGDTLAIHWMPYPGFNAEATIGYFASQDPRASPGNNWMRLTEHATPAEIAHELGHVLGLVHEHQRWDRDDFVEFRCKNLKGMIDIINDMVNKEKVSFDEATKALCEDDAKARQYGAPSGQYIKGAGLDVKTKPTLDGPGGFDLDSIMIYDSFHASPASPGDQTDTAVLVAIKKDANGNKIRGSEKLFRSPQKPSPLDVEFVKRFYPWDQAAHDEWKKNNPGKKH